MNAVYYIIHPSHVDFNMKNVTEKFSSNTESWCLFCLNSTKSERETEFLCINHITKGKNLVILCLILRYTMKIILEPDTGEFDENFTEPDHDINDEISSKILINDHQKLIIFQVLTIIEN